MHLNVVASSNLLPRTILLQNWTDLVYAVKAGVDKFSGKSRSHFKILCSGRVMYSKFHSEGPQILDARVQNLLFPAELAP